MRLIRSAARTFAAAAATLLVASTSTLTAQISLGGYTFDNNAGPDVCTSYGGDAWFRGDTTPGCASADLMPGAANDSESIQLVLTSNDVQHWIQGIGRIEMNFVDNSIANGPGADIIVFEQGGAEAFDLQVFDPVAGAFTAPITYLPVSTGFIATGACFAYGYNAAEIDLDDFGIPSTTLITRLRIDTKGTAPGCCTGCDILQVLALNSVTDIPPTADAGPDQSVIVPVGQSVQLDGSASSDDVTPSGSLVYSWTLVSVPGGSGATLTGAGTAMPTFVPDVDGDYTAELVVTDSIGQTSAPDQVLVAVAVDDPPVANAGPDQLALTGALVQLDGSLSTDDLTASASLVFAWTITAAPAGSTAGLAGAGTGMPSFVPDLAGSYAIDLVVTDGSGQSSPPDQVVVTASALNAAPTADAGSDATTPTNVAVQLDGTASSDPDLDPLGYQWTLVSAPAGSAAVLVDDTTATPSITPDLPGNYVVELVVDDGQVSSAADSVEIEAIDAADFARARIGEADGFVRGLPLSSFYSGTSGNPQQQAKRAKIVKFLMRLNLRIAAWKVRLLDHAVQSNGSAQQIAARKRSALRSLRRTAAYTDGVTLRGLPDERGSGFRPDLITEPTAATTVYDFLQQAITAVEAVQ